MLTTVDADLAPALGAVNASTAQLVSVIRACLAERLWEVEETRRPEHWVAVRCGVSPSRAARLVRIAERIEEFPAVAAAFEAGQMTEDHVDVIVRHAHPSHDRALDGAGVFTIGQLRRVIAALPVPDDDVEMALDDEDTPPAERDVIAFGWCDDGRFRGHVDVGAELGSLIEAVLRSARNAAFRDRTGTDADDDAPLADITTITAMDRLCRVGLEALDSTNGPTARHQVLVHVDADHPERSRINLGPLLSKRERQHVTCDAELRAVLFRDGHPVVLGRSRRVAPPLLRALITDRDMGCRIDGCGRTRWLHIHHLVHWEQGGPTDPTNLVALCSEHHRDVHHGRLRLSGDPTRPDGLVVVDRHGRPPPRPWPVRRPHPPPDSTKPYDGPERGRLENEMVLNAGSTALVTGATSGLGLEVARRIAPVKARLYLVGRDADRVARAAAEVSRASGNDDVHVLVADLSSQEEVRRLAAEYRADGRPLDLLVNNAGAVFGLRREVSVDGIEMTFALNHLAYFSMAVLLAPARIVNVTGDAYKDAKGRFDFADYNAERRYRPIRQYAMSKLANILFTRELARRLDPARVTVNAAGPSRTTATRFAHNVHPLAKVAMRLASPLLLSVEKGAAGIVHLCMSPDVQPLTGTYWSGMSQPELLPAATNDDDAARLWQLSSELTGLHPPVEGRVPRH